jgi:SAM-dependent MidA family methyltransferase
MSMAISGNEVAADASLGERLRTRIRREGAISFRDWMQAALYDEREGYYCRGDRPRWGRAGDYRTAPESSPLFAATFARYFAKLFAELGWPASWTIIEAGAGAGEFAREVLVNLCSDHPTVFAATHYQIDEVSPDARARAAASLAEFGDRVEFLGRSEDTEALAQGIVFSNELIDAFPVHRVAMRGGRLRELCVSVNEKGDFIWAEGDLDKQVEEYCAGSRLQLVEGQVAEVNLGADDFISRAASLLDKGFVITVDYGAERNELLSAPHRRAGTLRAFRRHQIVDDVFAKPGEQDLTTTVDWTQIREAGERVGFLTARYERLDQFLMSEGLLDELEKLTRELSPADALRLSTSAREMIMPHGLAASYQVLVQRKSQPGKSRQIS